MSNGGGGGGGGGGDQTHTDFAKILHISCFGHASQVSKRPQWNSKIFEFWNTLQYIYATL